MSDDLDPYSVLGIDRGCDQEALKKRYQVLAKEVRSQLAVLLLGLHSAWMDEYDELAIYR